MVLEMMFRKKNGLTNRQMLAICTKFQCKKNEFVAHRLMEGYLVAVHNKEYRVKFSDGWFSKIVYVKEVQRRVGKRI